ncbi:hypothetical protein [Flexivirga oryzae]|uniref:Uncharacterized protein n=1 Tax=Flexivirga oryzae TaxID=1794944 RepID=A0A839N538_9MICO|nr:hypothetical protein [Flexivirga oryzae]MBB2892858.1 hypothetical protein [Flexivirga oryzae]
MQALDRGRRRWPFITAAVVLVLLDLFAVLVFITGVFDRTTDTGGKVGGLVVSGCVIVLVTWLATRAGRAARRRGVPETLPGLPVVSTARRAGGVTVAIVFLGLAAVILCVETTGLIRGDTSGAGAGLTGAAMCAGVGILGVNMSRTPSAAQRARVLGAQARAVSQGVQPIVGSVVGPPDPRLFTTPSWVRAPVDRSAGYSEQLSEVPWLLLTGCVLAGVAVIWGMARLGGGWVGVLMVPLIVIIFLLVAILIFVPYGIELRGGVLTIGAILAPRIGRGWKRQDIPLEEVVAWTVCPRTRARVAVPRSPFPEGDFELPARPGKRVGNWGNFTGIGVRTVLVVRVDPARVPAAMPSVILNGYSVSDTRNTAVDLGVYVIGTRHAARLARTLDKAMPSRRSLT